jgi:integrase/recombinase XerD
MNKLKDEKLFKLIRDYLLVYLPEQKYCSMDTVKSYRESLNILLDYVTKVKKISIEEITFSILNFQLIAEFLDWLEKERNCCISTRNHRLSCIRSFFKYAGNMYPDSLVYWSDL